MISGACPFGDIRTDGFDWDDTWRSNSSVLHGIDAKALLDHYAAAAFRVKRWSGVGTFSFLGQTVVQREWWGDVGGPGPWIVYEFTWTVSAPDGEDKAMSGDDTPAARFYNAFSYGPTKEYGIPPESFDEYSFAVGSQTGSGPSFPLPTVPIYPLVRQVPNGDYYDVSEEYVPRQPYSWTSTGALNLTFRVDIIDQGGITPPRTFGGASFYTVTKTVNYTLNFAFDDLGNLLIRLPSGSNPLFVQFEKGAGTPFIEIIPAEDFNFEDYLYPNVPVGIDDQDGIAISYPAVDYSETALGSYEAEPTHLFVPSEETLGASRVSFTIPGWGDLPEENTITYFLNVSSDTFPVGESSVGTPGTNLSSETEISLMPFFRIEFTPYECFSYEGVWNTTTGAALSDPLTT